MLKTKPKCRNKCLDFKQKYNKPYSSVWLEHRANNAGVVGSIPTVAKFLIF